jgi:hypothetical protein
MNIVDAIQRLSIDIYEFSSLICMIKNIMSLHLSLQVKFIKRQANMVVHTFAKVTISWSSRFIFETLTPCNEHLLLNEMN